ncbi:arginine--tRNA ligase [Oxalobacter sp. OxGP1]|uniref:arginine--tRNA ligase n=1 Tax=Oxalobacter paeniformigenes TaxID=2946594 RepID=UPI0022AEF56F|nr:arginine--tRNA ligase [Oxalobacter paeniformigenes]MCZ4053559.1 arginine--tRNA ligase [Oxalobacter paeniformigenes]
MLAQQKQQITSLFQNAVNTLTEGNDLAKQPVISLERPRDAAHGDVACNIAMQLAKPLRKNPREIAKTILDNVLTASDSRELIASGEIAGPGFINLRLTPAAKQRVVRTVLEQKEKFGYGNRGAGKKVMVEFVSANPTGPLHVGHGRQGALGDAISALFETQGYDVTREFYYNDAGVQIDNLTRSVQARAKGLKPGDAGWPESAYNGDYIADIAADFMAKKTVTARNCPTVTASGNADDLQSIREFSVAYLRNEQDNDLNAFGIHFDNFFLESSLYRDGKVQEAVEALTREGKTFESDGALWLKTTEYGDDKDRVMRKTDGTYTYFVPDVAYHINKWKRGFDKVINVQGSDHHGTVARVRAGLQAVNQGIPAGFPDYVLHKMVTVMKDGAEVKISKRAGSYVTVRDLIEWSGAGDIAKGRDAVRFFLISRKADTEFVFDIDLALSQSDENPVYYVQYAHARICSVFAQWGGDESVLENVDLSPLVSSHENALLTKLADYPDMLSRAQEELSPHLIAFYLRELAGELHGYYNAERFLVDDEPTKLARLALLKATRQVLRNGLALLGVSAPVKM